MATVTNADLAKRLDELTRLVAQKSDGAAWEGWRHDVEVKLTELGAQVNRLAEIIENGIDRDTRRETCPFQVEIARAANNHQRLSSMENVVQQLRVDLAKQSVAGGAAGGGIVSIIAGVIIAIGKAAGWW